MQKEEIIAKLRDMAKYPTVTLPRDREVLRMAADLLAQPEQDEKFCDANCVWTNHHPDCKLAQPQRTWVGLTKKEVDDCYEAIMFNLDIDPPRMGVYLEIEAKLKEKNND